jgi:hypothetical protein
MQHRLLLATLLLLPACAQRYAAPASVQSSAAPDEVFQCVKRQLADLDYKQSSIDVDEHRVSGTKYDTEARRADVQFRRLAHRIEVQVGPDAGGQTTLGVTSHTFAEYTTQRGPTEVEEKAADQVKSDAQKLLDACRG